MLCYTGDMGVRSVRSNHKDGNGNELDGLIFVSIRIIYSLELKKEKNNKSCSHVKQECHFEKLYYVNIYMLRARA